MPINKNEITKETIEKAMACQTPEELMEFAKANGHVMTKEEAEAYLAEFEDVELDSALLEKVAGGWGFSRPLAEKCEVYCPHV